jgi:cell filamentation protein
VSDPYVYPGSNVLINLLDIRDADRLRDFETEITAQRIAEGLPGVPLTPDGYRQLHRHIFQDVYEWAGQIRTLDISKPNAYFCHHAYIKNELDKRFAKIADETKDRSVDAGAFVKQAAEHLSELNAIHPFREGNGRTLRAFLETLGEQAGYPVDLRTITPVGWHAASVESFQTAGTLGFERLIANSLCGDLQRVAGIQAVKLAEQDAEEKEIARLAAKGKTTGRGGPDI